jgi:hypothetical protein
VVLLLGKVTLRSSLFILEARFVNLNPFMQQMFLKLHDIEDSKKKDFILETLRREFKDRDFYFRALRSLVVLSFPQLVSFSSVFPSL